MSIFRREGGIMDVIRCDEHDFLIWKWSPNGIANSTHKENGIRKGSRIAVNEGQLAVFVYSKGGGTAQEYLMGPYDGTVDNANLPVLTGLLAALYDGNAPFRAEVYYINLAKLIQIRFGVPFFDIFDPRVPDIGLPVAVRGSVNFSIADYSRFIELHRLDSFDMDRFYSQIKQTLIATIKNIVINTAYSSPLPAIQIESQAVAVKNAAFAQLKEHLLNEYGVTVSALDISAIEIDKTSAGYRQLMSVTRDLTSARMKAESEVSIKDLKDMQRINAENTADTLRRQREEMQYAQHLNTQGANFAVHQLNKQAEIAAAAASSFNNSSLGGGFSPAGMMAGMTIGGAMGQNMANAVNNVMNTNGFSAAPPPIPVSTYYVAIDGKQNGPFDMATLGQMVTTGTLTKETLVWKQGMANWQRADSVSELIQLFTNNNSVPPIPGV